MLLVYCLALGVSAFAEDKPRVYITDSNSWEISGGFAAGGDSAAGAVGGGARPQTAEVMHTFRKRCPEVIITIVKGKADYAVILDHEGGKGILRRDNKIAVFSKDGDLVFSSSTRSLGNAVKVACSAILTAPQKKAETSK